MRRVLVLLLACSCATAPLPAPVVATSKAALEAPAPAPEVFPLQAGEKAPVDGLLVVPDRYVSMLKAEQSCAVPSVPANPLCSEPLVKSSTAFWAGMAVGSVVGVVATGLLVYGAVEVVKTAK